jgi:hypothetical protein
MITRKLGKDLIFFSPGEKGSVFTYRAGYAVDFNMLDSTVSQLELESENDIVYIEDRRKKTREI